MLSRVALVLGLLALATTASAQEGVLILHTSSDRSQSHDLRAWVGALRRQLGATHVRRLEDSDCWPEDAACAARFTRSANVRQILLVRVLWERAGCVPIRDASGGLSGHRMLRTAMLDLTLLDAEGHTIAQQSRPAEIAAAERSTAAAELAHALGL